MRNKTVYILWIVQPWSPIFLFSTARVKIKLRDLEGHISFKLKLKRHLLFLSFKKNKKQYFNKAKLSKFYRKGIFEL